MKRSTKIFFKSFVCALLSFALVSSFFILSQSGANARENSSYSSSNLRFTPKQTDKFTILLTISKDNADFPHAIFLISLNALEGKVRVLRLPEVSVLSSGGENKIILKECFQKNGEMSATKAISNFFGIEVSRYISFTNQSFVSLIDLFEPCVLDVTEDISEVDRKNDIYIKIDRGRRLISGSLMLDIFAYKKWKGGATEKFSKSADALSAFFSQNGADLLRARQFILSNAKTNLSALDFENRQELISYLFSLSNTVESVKVHGEYQLEDTQFALSTNTKTKIAALF